MKLIKTSIVIAMACLISSSTSCQKEKYPELGDGLYAEIVTGKGTMVAKLTYDKTPVTVANFVALAEGEHPMVADQYKGKPFYNGLIFHRVMDDFMIQGGDAKGTGSGSPGYKFPDELTIDLKHDKPGVLAMANPGANANGSQFYITEKATPWLDGYDAEGNLKNCDNPRVYCHTVFGEVVLGMDVRDSISNVKVGNGNRPEQDVVIEQVNIIRQGFDARKFDAVNTWNTELTLLEERNQKAREEAERKAEEARKAAEEKALKASEETLASFNEYKTKTTASATGLQSYTITKGNGPKVKQGQRVKVNYEGYFTDGRLLDSNVKELEELYGKFNQQKELRGLYGPMEMTISPDEQLISGFKEGVASMNVGDRTYFYIPSHLAYGEQGRSGIPPNTDLIFILEIVELVQ